MEQSDESFHAFEQLDAYKRWDVVGELLRPEHERQLASAEGRVRDDPVEGALRKRRMRIEKIVARAIAVRMGVYADLTKISGNLRKSSRFVLIL